MENLRKALIRLAHQKPELRPHLLPLLKTAGAIDRVKKHGEWNLSVYKSRRTRWDYFLQNPEGGGGGSTSYKSAKAAIAAATGHTNFRDATRVWLILAVWDPEAKDYKVTKTGWLPVKSAIPRAFTEEEKWEMFTR